jgi:hypothetical protein
MMMRMILLFATMLIFYRNLIHYLMMQTILKEIYCNNLMLFVFFMSLITIYCRYVYISISLSISDQWTSKGLCFWSSNSSSSFIKMEIHFLSCFVVDSNLIENDCVVSKLTNIVLSSSSPSSSSSTQKRLIEAIGGYIAGTIAFSTRLTSNNDNDDDGDGCNSEQVHQLARRFSEVVVSGNKSASSAVELLLWLTFATMRA